ncbi:MAG TPA: hypothetical protein VK024_09620, partial [Actinomycetaceae bacterium]|nr:hypothetical protein [Actinomycetaceae bacterium]
TAEHASDAAAQAVRATPAALLLDADLAVLGSHPSRYARYVREIRAEYPHVPDDDFRRGRRRVLEALLARRHLFVTPRGREWWEEQARRNMTAELAALPAITP